MNLRSIELCKGALWAAVILCLLAPATFAATYYVAPDGTDTYPGGTQDEPWASINFGDLYEILEPGDTVVVKAGTYMHTTPGMGTLNKRSGTADKPITYIAHGRVIIDGGQTAEDPGTYATMLLGGGIDHIIFDGFELTGARRCMNITGTDANPAVGNIVRNCVFRDNWGGYMMQNVRIQECQIYNNIFAITGSVEGAEAARGIHNGFTLFGNKIYNNTIYIDSTASDAAAAGILFANVSAAADTSKMGTDEVRNNIVWPRHPAVGLWAYTTVSVYDPPGAEPGTWFGVPFKHSHNIYWPEQLRFLWAFPGAFVAGGPPYANCTLYDAAILGDNDNEWYGDPLFVDAFNGDFRLQPGSTSIDAGIDVGLAFNGAAPDLGALPAYQAATVADIISKPDGTVFSLPTSVATVASGVFKGNVMYVEDESRASGVMVSSLDPLPTIAEGDRVQISGKLATIDGQRLILATSVSPLSSGAALKPLGTPGKSLSGEGLDNVGLLATTWGKVTFAAADNSYFCIDDGSGKTDGLGNAGVPVVVSDLVQPISPLPDPSGSPYVSVTGLIGKKDLGGGVVPVIRLRAANDIN